METWFITPNDTLNRIYRYTVTYLLCFIFVFLKLCITSFYCVIWSLLLIEFFVYCLFSKFQRNFISVWFGVKTDVARQTLLRDFTSFKFVLNFSKVVLLFHYLSISFILVLLFMFEFFFFTPTQYIINIIYFL